MLVDHIDLRVRDLAPARAFFDIVLPELGLLPGRLTSLGHVLYELQIGWEAGQFVCLEADPKLAPDSTRIAFAAQSREAVDRVAAVLELAGARNIEGPMRCPEYSSGYYAVFFDDPDGNRFEVCVHD